MLWCWSSVVICFEVRMLGQGCTSALHRIGSYVQPIPVDVVFPPKPMACIGWLCARTSFLFQQ